MVVIAYGLLLPRALLEWPRLGCINLHASLLPRWRGAAPIQRAMLAGDAETGISVMQMDAGLDTGPVHLDARRRRSARSETAGALHDRLAAARGARRCSTRCRRCCAGTSVAVPQQRRARDASRRRSRRPKRCSTGASRPPLLERRVRAFNPWPVAEAKLSDGRRLRVFEATAARGRAGRAPPGTIVAAGRAGIDVATRRRRAASAPNPAAFGSRDGRRGLSRGAFAGGSGVCRLSRAGGRQGTRRRGAARRARARRARCRPTICCPRPVSPLATSRCSRRSCSARCAGTTGSSGRPRGCSRARSRATKARSRRCCASVCCSCRSCASRSTQRCRRRSTRRQCSGCAARAGSSTRCCAGFSASASSSTQAALRSRRGAIRAPVLAHRRDARRPSARLASGPRGQQRGAADVAARQSAAHDARGTISTSSRRPGWPRSPHRTSSPPCCLAEPIGVESLPGFATGEVSVQDLSAQHAARLLELDAGQRVLDACAAPGGKTGHILEAMSGRGEVWAVDRDAARLDRVRDNLERLGLDGEARRGRRDGTGGVVGRPAVRPDSHRRAVQRDRRDPPPSRHQGAAPAGRTSSAPSRCKRACSGACGRCSRPGGRLVYATCSVLRRENDEQIARFSRRRADDRGRGRSWRRCNCCPRRHAATASIMLGYESRKCCECPVDLLAQP